MLRLKDPKKIIYYAFQVCLIEGCTSEAEKLFATESSIIDVCTKHYNQLEAEKYLT